MNEFPETNWAYIAGLLDRRGSFSINKYKKTNCYNFSISLQTKSKSKVEMFSNKLKGKIIKKDYRSNSKLGLIDHPFYLFQVDINFFEEIFDLIYKYSLRKDMLNIFMKMRLLIKQENNIKLKESEIEERTKTYQGWCNYKEKNRESRDEDE